MLTLSAIAVVLLSGDLIHPGENHTLADLVNRLPIYTTPGTLSPKAAQCVPDALYTLIDAPGQML
jgi:hypothetical protein